MSQKSLITIIKFNLLVSDIIGFWALGNVSYYWFTGGLAPQLLFQFNFLLLVLLNVFVYHIFNNYTPVDRDLGLILPFRFIISFLIAFGISALFVFISPYRYQGGFWSWKVFYTTLGLFFFWGFLVRIFYFFYVKSHMEKIKSRWLFIMGGDAARQVLSEIQNMKLDWDVHILLDPQTKLDASLKKILGNRMVGKWDDLEKFIHEDWNGIVMGFNPFLPEKLVQGLMKARIHGYRVMDLSDFYEHVWEKVPVLHLKDGWFVFSQGFSILHNRIGLEIKLLIDFFLSFILFFTLLPVMFITAIIIKLESTGPIIYKQERTGRNGKEFTLYKFRSMRMDAEKSGAAWARKNDNRVTKVGRFIRLTRIDELPQLWNVLRGDMSFIGPRPERPVFNDLLEKKIPYYDLRHLVKPGITGWAQVLYPYGASEEDARKKLEYDLYYIKNYSVLLDFRIIFKTIRVILFVRGR